MVKTSPSHGEDRSSTLLRVTRTKKLRSGGASFFVAAAPASGRWRAPLNAGEAGQESYSAKPPGGCFGDPLSAVGGLAVSFVGNSEVCASPLFAYPIWHTVPRRMLRPRFDFASAFSIVAANARG